MPALLSLALALLPGSPQDAQPVEPARPRVGLVLSAGAAHVLAQAGALQALEELRVPVDFVIGSEGGGLIGGLYAAGLSAREVQELLRDRIWLDALSGRVPRTLLSWRQRTVDRDFLFDLPVSFGPGSLGLARGMARTRWISWLLSSTTSPVADRADFDDLPIPFRCVATDLLAGESVVLGSGDLPSAILSGIATPGLYGSVEVAGRELGSGALLDPLPVGIALERGCDALVVVDCTFPVDRRERLGSFLSASAHVRVLAGEQARRAALASLRPGDVLVEPDPAGADEQDFRGAQALVASGHAAVMARAGDLARLALAPPAYERHLAERRARRHVPPAIARVRFEDQSGLDAAVLRDRVDSGEDRPLDQEELSRDLLRLYGLDYHERIEVALEPHPDGGSDLVFRTHEATDDLWNPRAGVALEGVFGQDATFVLGAAFTFRPIDGRGAEWRNRVEVGSRILLFSEYWQPIDNAARWFVAPAVAYEQERQNVTVGEDVIAAVDVWSVGARLDVGRVLGEWGEARVGLVNQAGSVDLAVGSPGTIPGEDFDQGYAEGGITIDTVDSLALPREGTIGRATVNVPLAWMGGSESEEQSYLQTQIDHAITWDRTSLVLGAEYDTALDDEAALQNAFPLGGFLKLSGLGRDSISGAHAALGRAVTWVELGRRGLDRRLVDWNLGGSLEAGQVWAARDDIDLSEVRWSGSVFVAASTLFGPVFLGAGLTEPGEGAVFLVFGNLFGDWGLF